MQDNSHRLILYRCDDTLNRLELWPNSEVEEGTVQENGQYIIELTGIERPDETELFIDEARAEALRSRESSTARWMWDVGFYAGEINLRIDFCDGRRVELGIITDPDLRKLTRDDFYQMVRDILADTLGLFSLSGFRVGIGRGHGAVVPPIARLEFLRSRIDDIAEVVSRINSRPARILRSRRNVVPLHQAKLITSSELIRSLQGGSLSRVENKTVRDRFPARLGGYMPESVRKNTRSTGLDIREHQEIYNAILVWAGILDLYASRLNQLSQTQGTENLLVWERRCRGLSNRLRRLLEMPVFDDVSLRNVFPSISSIYRRLPAYRDFYTLYQDMNLGIANITGDFLQMPLARTYDLYEIWCFLRILRGLHHLGYEFQLTPLMEGFDPGSGTLTIPVGNVTISLSENQQIAFQKSYVEYWKDVNSHGSFSRPMQPDISIEHGTSESAPRITVLDAKYRIESQLNNAITSIHTYRDAIVAAYEDESDGITRTVKAAYILTPYTPQDGNKQDWQQTSMPGRIFIVTIVESSGLAL